ncbi:transporter substrate-binding domain-containing protein [Pararhizobium sp. DWP1-1-3]|uniref:transporter substrate-binding domain-containing protein n=1 Tax=Pararhizobium sp. DWP1-1-3 TaxID=2804652 RepID=UPI003CF020ED
MSLRKLIISAGIGFISIVALSAAAKAESTLQIVQKRGYLTCGSNEATLGFGLPNSKGYWEGLDIDTCRAMAVAIFADKDAARFVPLSGAKRMTALAAGEVDYLPRTTIGTLQRDANGANFIPTNSYGYDGFMVRKSLGVAKVQDMAGASVCVQSGSTTEVTVSDISRALGLDLKLTLFEAPIAAREAFFADRCDALIAGDSFLASVRANQAPNPDDYIIFPANDIINASRPAVRHGDDQWFDIAKWSFLAMVRAEEMGVTQSNVDEMLKSQDPNIRRFLGVEPGNGAALGLDEKFAYNIVKQLGNYAEMFDRNLGSKSKLKLSRGYNALVKDGGLMQSDPFN